MRNVFLAREISVSWTWIDGEGGRAACLIMQGYEADFTFRARYCFHGRFNNITGLVNV